MAEKLTPTEWKNGEKFTDRKIFKWTQVPKETVYLVISIETKVHLHLTFHVIHQLDKNNKTYKKILGAEIFLNY